jgi:hypothetical protein
MKIKIDPHYTGCESGYVNVSITDDFGKIVTHKIDLISVCNAMGGAVHGMKLLAEAVNKEN